MAGLFRYGFTRKGGDSVPDDEPDEDSEPQQASTSQAPPQKRRSEDTSASTGSSDQSKKAKKVGQRREVKIATIKNWQKQTGNGDKGQGGTTFKQKRPDLTWIRYEEKGNVAAKVWCFYCRRKPEILRTILT